MDSAKPVSRLAAVTGRREVVTGIKLQIKAPSGIGPDKFRENKLITTEARSDERGAAFSIRPLISRQVLRGKRLLGKKNVKRVFNDLKIHKLVV